MMNENDIFINLTLHSEKFNDQEMVDNGDNSKQEENISLGKPIVIYPQNGLAYLKRRKNCKEGRIKY